jgi:cytochrome c biogenesis protein CcmG, thiol:disulfide interchange protein DsbE
MEKIDNAYKKNPMKLRLFCTLFCCFFALHLSARQSDSISPQGYYVETFRPQHTIKATFPFDIDLQDSVGKTFNSSKLLAHDGKTTTVILFWLTTCAPCRMELEAFAQNYEEWKKEVPNLRIVAISIDFSDNIPAFQRRVREGKWAFEAYHDRNREFQWVMPGNLNGLPQLFIYDKNDKVVFYKKRFVPGDERDIFEHIKKNSQ